MISADATQNQISRLLAEGAQAYLTKPLLADVQRTAASALGEEAPGRMDGETPADVGGQDDR